MSDVLHLSIKYYYYYCSTKLIHTRVFALNIIPTTGLRLTYVAVRQYCLYLWLTNALREAWFLRGNICLL